MELLETAVLYAVLLFVVAAIFGYLPFRISKSPAIKSWSMVLSAGLMIGVLFFMMFPEALEEGGEKGFPIASCFECILAGFLMVLFMGYVLFILQRRNRSGNTARSLWIGFCVDAFMDGIVISAGLLAGNDVGMVVMFAMCMNKATEVFALSTQILSLADHGSAKKMMVVYTILNPIAVMIGYFGLSIGPGDITSPALCFGSGIFMFAALSEMIPKTFEGDNRFNFKTIAVFAMGIALAYALKVITDVF